MAIPKGARFCWLRAAGDGRAEARRFRSFNTSVDGPESTELLAFPTASMPSWAAFATESEANSGLTTNASTRSSRSGRRGRKPSMGASSARIHSISRCHRSAAPCAPLGRCHGNASAHGTNCRPERSACPYTGHSADPELAQAPSRFCLIEEPCGRRPNVAPRCRGICGPARPALPPPSRSHQPEWLSLLREAKHLHQLERVRRRCQARTEPIVERHGWS